MLEYTIKLMQRGYTTRRIHGLIQKGDRVVQTQPEKSQVAIGFLRKFGMDPLEKQLDTRVQLLLEGVCTM